MQNTSEYKASIFSEISEEGAVDFASLQAITALDSDALTVLLGDLCREGQLMKTKKGRYTFPSTLGLVHGRIQGNQKGFGFLIPSDGSADLYIGRDGLLDALHGDTVFVRPLKKGDEAEVVQVLERANDIIVGLLENDGSHAYVIPDERRIHLDILIPADKLNGAQNGDKVVVRITKYHPSGRNPSGRIIEVLGQQGDPHTNYLALLRLHHLEEGFPQNVLAAAQKLPSAVLEDELKGREDLRSLNIFTIDGADTQDFDDAISIEKTNGVFRLGVHIADVSHYVKSNSILDQEAARRATSVYFPGHVLPMLPEQLSNGICSLNPGVDRLTLSCIMDIDSSGQVLEYTITPSVIQSKARLVYDDVTRALENRDPSSLQGQYEALVTLQELYEALRAKRMARGALDLDVDESHITLGEDGVPVSVQKAQRGVANKMIEEFMLVANETVAAHAKYLELPFLYRVHETPNPEKIKAFDFFVSNLGYSLKGSSRDSIHPKTLQAVLNACNGTSESPVISSIMLRSLQKARYFPTPLGHFGLAAKDYCHFTSPIRRYPDLFIHRVLKAQLAGRPIRAYAKNLEENAKHCSEKERAAMEAERAMDDSLKCRFMQDKVGEEFDGIVTGVTGFGVFVALENTIEGLIHVNELDDDYYVFNEKLYTLTGERKRKTFALGDGLRVKVEAVNTATRRIEFSLVSKDEPPQKRAQKKPAEPKPAAKKSTKAKSHRKPKKGNRK